MRRIIVLGGSGLFGRVVAEQLSTLGFTVQNASRRAGTELPLDANDAASIKAALREGDLVIDTAGPFQARSMALIDAAIDTHFDIVDLNDSLVYAERVLELELQIANAGIRVLSAASTVSAIAATVVRHSRVERPRRVTAFLAPATRYTANAGAARSLVESVGRPVRVWREGRMQEQRGWSEPQRFTMPKPVGPICGRILESADALLLPRIWPTLQDVTMHVDANTLGLNLVLQAARVVPGLRNLLLQQMSWGTWVARQFGSAAGGVGYEVEDANGRIMRYAIVGKGNSQLAAVAPAILATRAILMDQFEHRGLVLPDRHVEPAELIEFLQTNGITFTELS